MPKTDSPKTKIVARPPIVCVMGHVDHGKSTLLDYIRKTDVAGGEAGGITQKIGAYEVEHIKSSGEKKSITFLDTPGHEAFAAIRARGADVADIAILVVSAEDGVKPQTMDAFLCIQRAKLPVIVAINKIDKPNADIERTKGSLAENEIYLEGYGGDIPWVAISSKAGTGIPELLELIDLVAEINNFSGEAENPASGFIIEAHQDSRRGPSATVVIKNGTLRQSEAVVAGIAMASIKIMEDDKGTMIKEATMGMPVKIIGWSKLPEAGSAFLTLSTKKEAEILVEKNAEKIVKKVLEKTAPTPAPTADSENAKSKTDGPQIVTIPIIIKADATGTIDAILHELKKINLENVKVKIVSQGVGDISEKDAKAAESSKDIVIIGFNVDIDSRAKTITERSSVNIVQFDVIYKLSEWLETLSKERTPKIKVEEKSGMVKILKAFSKEKDRQILGGKVLNGKIAIGDEVKITRGEISLGVGRVKELQRQKAKIDEVPAGSEFGTLIEAKITIAPGDIVEPFKIVEK
ncbi:MAG TPA: translation initiation factor IF-2 [Candidatus Paceibacterota bacterium]